MFSSWLRTTSAILLVALSTISTIFSLPTSITMVGGIPKKITSIIRVLKGINGGASGTRAPHHFKNRCILYGPPGNGKSTLAKIVADESGSEFLRLDGPSIVGSYVGQGANTVKELFERAYQLSQSTGQCVIIFIDEIDAIAVSNNSEFRGEHQAALQQLWLELDKCKHYPQIFVICATNFFNKLSKTFLDRFASNTIEIKNPDEALRSAVLEHYCIFYEVECPEAQIKKFARKTHGLSIRSLEDFVCELASSQEHLNRPLQESEALALIAELRKKYDENISEKKEGNESALQLWSLRIGIASSVLTSIFTIYQFYTAYTTTLSPKVMRNLATYNTGITPAAIAG